MLLIFSNMLFSKELFVILLVVVVFIFGMFFDNILFKSIFSWSELVSFNVFGSGYMLKSGGKTKGFFFSTKNSS